MAGPLARAARAAGRRVFAAAVVAGAITLAPAAAFSCTAICLPGRWTPEDAFRRSPIVLIGTALKVETGKSATVQVDELYKGTVPAIVEVDSGWNTDCRMWLEEGKQYLLFFERPERGARKLVPEHLCSPSGEVGRSHMDEAVAWVRRRLPLVPVAKGECLPVRYSEDGKARRADVSVTLVMGAQRIPAPRCEGGFVVSAAVAGYAGPIHVELAVRGRRPTFEVRAGHFDRVSRWAVDVDRPPFRVRTAEEIAAQERVAGKRIHRIYTLAPEATDGAPVMQMLYLFED